MKYLCRYLFMLFEKDYICKIDTITMKNLIRLRWLFAAVGLFTFLQYFSVFHFYYIEQNQLFLFTQTYILDRFSDPAGFALLVSEGLVQFFMLPYMGAAISTLLLLGVGLLIERVLKILLPDKGVFWLSLFLVFALLMPFFDFNYRLQGMVAFLMMLLSLWGCLLVLNSKIRLLITTVCVPVLYFLAGPVSVLFAVCVLMVEFLKHRSGSYGFVLPLGLAVLISILVVFFAVEGEYRFSFLPDAYYHTDLHPRFSAYLAWVVLPLLIIIVFLSSKAKVAGKRKVAVILFQIVMLAVCLNTGIDAYGDQKSSFLKELDYYARTEQWGKITSRCEGKITNLLYLNYLNMALAHQGTLGDRMFNYDQKDARSLLVSWNQTAQISTLLSDIYFVYGNVALAQEMAFEGYIASPGYGNPRLLKRLVETNLILGTYPVAEKYISILEHTFYYRKWATDHRKFLYRDDRVEQDPLLGRMRKCTSSPNRLVMMNGLLTELEQIAVSNPQNRATFDYLACFCLLCKDLNKFSELVGKYYGTPVLPSIPVHYQEALIIMNERNTEDWKKLGISDAVAYRFVDYKKQVLANKDNPNFVSLMEHMYGGTYWFFYMFK